MDKKFASLIDIVYASEGLEGYDFNNENVEIESKELLENIDKKTILAFLDCPGTILQVGHNHKGNYELYAYNKDCNEMVRVKGLGDHFITLIDVLTEAQSTLNSRIHGKNKQLLSSNFVKRVNLSLQQYREGEVAIGNYRTVNFIGAPVEVYLGSGTSDMIKCVKLETSKNKNVVNKMKELIDWVNNTAFKDSDKLYDDVAEFHARFIKIHPFRDGNGRTARLLTNYLLIANGGSMISIDSEKKDEYNLCLNYANATSNELFIDECEEYKEFYEKMFKSQGNRTDSNKYKPLAKFLSECEVHNNKIFNEVIDYKNRDEGTFQADQIL